MVNLSRVHPESATHQDRREARDTSVQTTEYAGVYGTKYAAEELPHYVMNQRGMPADVAYRLISDELSLDGNPLLNMASFVTTYMEQQAQDLMADAISKNFIDFEQYPQSAKMQTRCVNMIAELFNAPTNKHSNPQTLDAPEEEAEGAMGTSTVGSSEAIMLGLLAMKKTWQKKRRSEGKDTSNPNIIMNSAVQVCWEKAARYFDVEERYVYCTEDRYVIDPVQAVDLVDENTIGICAILGTTYTGHYEDVKGINDLLVERGIDCPIHVDAASGGFVAPFICPEREWDFRLEKVVSINVSGHKYGLVYPGIGWVFWRSPSYLPKELIFNVNYLGAEQATFTLNFSKGAAHIIGQYYQLIRLGRNGYKAVMQNLVQVSQRLAGGLRNLGLIILSDNTGNGSNGVPLVAFRLPDDESRLFDEFALSAVLRRRGWVVPAYTMAPKSNNLKLMRVVVREDFTAHRCGILVEDVKRAMEWLEDMDETTVERYTKQCDRYVAEHGTSLPNAHSFYGGEEHSLQGKTGKTHAVC
ncbi:pyridoxal phosphate-dependent transferase [Aspergillus karnatakaensis]|uniref:pyridoxal phosphate-dependent transferase n=1 Tax=Aspergillus karnatakaensis TaxID=1810916 RepID=UPI003CCDFB46